MSDDDSFLGSVCCKIACRARQGFLRPDSSTMVLVYTVSYLQDAAEPATVTLRGPAADETMQVRTIAIDQLAGTLLKGVTPS